MGYELYLKERKEVLTNIDPKSNLVSLCEEEKEEEEEIPRSSCFRSNQYDCYKKHFSLSNILYCFISYSSVSLLSIE